MKRLSFPPAVVAALTAALLFGASTPFAKQLLRDVSPVLLAGLLYLGSVGDSYDNALAETINGL